MGERSPVNDTTVRGMFANLSMNTTREEMSLAVLEGVAFSLRENIDLIKSQGVRIEKSKVCGGGIRNKLFCHILSTVLNLELEVPKLEHGGVLGACILAAKGVGNNVSDSFFRVGDIVQPVKDSVEFYNGKYKKYQKLYPIAKSLK